MNDKVSKSENTPQPTTAKATPQAAPAVALTRIIIVHGDKGGVGKSFVGQALTDYLSASGQKVAVIDCDTANPDVSRMFAKSLNCQKTDLRSTTGWMDVMDFVIKHKGYTIVMNTPAGISGDMKKDMEGFSAFLESQDIDVQMELWWTMNIGHDSVNLLAKAITEYGHNFSKIRVLCNLHFANGDSSPGGPFMLWHESPLKTRLEKENGLTIFFPGLHLRVVSKIFADGKATPFSDAVDAAIGENVNLEASERWKLMKWLEDIKNLFEPTLKS